MAKIAHFGVARPCKGPTLAASLLLKLNDFGSYHAPNPKCRLGLGRLPGDIVIERGNLRIYLPLMTSFIISVVLSLILWFFGR